MDCVTDAAVQSAVRRPDWLPALVVVIFVILRYFKKEAWDSFFSMEARANEDGQIEVGWARFKHKIPMILFLLVATAMAVLSFVKRLSLIPVLGLLTCFYLMTQLGITNWTRFVKANTRA